MDLVSLVRAVPVKSRRSGFSLIEILLVVLIMGIVLGMTGSLMGGFFNMFEVSEDQSAAKLRANNVFNILSVPFQNAGIGLPSQDINTYHYFSGPSYAAPISHWSKPITIDNSGASPGTYNTRSGDRMRIIYALPTGVQTEIEVDAFGGEHVGSHTSLTQIKFTKDLPIGSSYIPYDLTVTGNVNAMSRFFTFPGMNMLPFHADSATGRTIIASGRQPAFKVSPDITGKGENVIRANHEMYLLRAAVAYVDSTGHFMLMDVDDSDPSSGDLYPPASDTGYHGLRVDGVKAIHFAQDPDARYITVSVMVEGDSSSTPRPSMKGLLETKWLEATGQTLSLTQGVHYEMLSMTYRTRNLQND
jgi:prepilin-type N-terminal cleavage/methylation domain-containing protein